MKKVLGALLVVLVVLAAVALERTFTFRSRQPQVAPVAVEPLDTAALAQRLAGALRFKTISYQDSSQFDAREFDGFQRYLRATFPRLHAALKREQVNGYGLLYEWTGSDPNRQPIVLLAHQDEGGHSSMPPKETAVGMLAAALTRLEHQQMPRAIRGPTADLFDYIGPEMPFGPRLVMANRWLLGGILAAQFGATPYGNAMLRTTTAPTVLQAGVKENVLPSSARALVNFRILPGDSVGSVLEHMRGVVD